MSRFSGDSSPIHGQSYTGNASITYSHGSSTFMEETRGTKLPDSVPFRDGIKRFTRIKKTENFDIDPSWSGMNIKPTTKDQLDMQILSQRVAHIIESTILNARLMGAIPKLLENNGALIRKWMRPEDANFVVRILGKTSVVEHSGGKQIKTVTGFLVDNDLQIAFRLLATNKCLPHYMEKFPPELTTYIRVFIHALTEFGGLMRRQMEMTAYEFVRKNANLRHLYEELRERRIEIRRYADVMNEHLDEHNAKLENKDEQLEDMEERITLTTSYYWELMQECLRTSDKMLFISGEHSALAQLELADAAKFAQVSCVQLRDAHLTEERILRTRKTKFEAQLAMWLSKYDADVGDRQAELDDLTDAFEKETAEMQELECLLLEQEKTYNRYMAEKEEEDLDVIRGKLFAIASVRAAKIIQNAWREYRRRKKKRRGKGKGKDKKGKGKGRK